MQADTDSSDQDSEIVDAVREVLEAAEVRRRSQGGFRLEPNWKHALVGLGGACVWSSIKAMSQSCAPGRLSSPWSTCGAPFESTVNGAAISPGRPVVRWVGLDGSSVSRISMPRSLAASVSEGRGGGIWMVTIVPGSFFEYEGFHCWFLPSSPASQSVIDAILALGPGTDADGSWLTEQGTVRDMICSEAVAGPDRTLTDPEFLRILTDVGKTTSPQAEENTGESSTSRADGGLGDSEDTTEPAQPS